MMWHIAKALAECAFGESLHNETPKNEQQTVAMLGNQYMLDFAQEQ